MQKKGFIFDLDGVIVDTARCHFLAWRKLARSIGIEFTELQNEQLKGVSRIRSLEKILNWGNTSIENEHFEELLRQKNDDYLSYIEKMDADEILPDVPKVLDHLTERGQKIALGSASKNARRILKSVHLYSSFHTIVDGNDVTLAKPDPEVFLKAAANLGIDAEDAIVFEDSIAGIQAANTANMISIGIGDKEILNEADYVFKDFREISVEFIDELIKK